jgi:hypothetical protein
LGANLLLLLLPLHGLLLLPPLALGLPGGV